MQSSVHFPEIESFKFRYLFNRNRRYLAFGHRLDILMRAYLEQWSFAGQLQGTGGVVVLVMYPRAPVFGQCYNMSPLIGQCYWV